MTKSTITKTWVAGLIIFAIGLIVGGISLGLMLAYGGQWTAVPGTTNNYTFQPNLDGFFWTTVSIMIAGFSVAAAGGIVQLAAWIGALVNTYQLQDRTWFLILLVGGLLSFAVALTGFAVMLAYVIAGPDSMATRGLQPMPPQQPMPAAELPQMPPMQPPMAIPQPESYPREMVPTH